MFERWGPEAKAVLPLAESLASEAGQHYVGPDHLLIALVEVDDPQVEAMLEGRGAQVRLATLAAMKRGRKPVPPPLPVVEVLARVFAMADKHSEKVREPVVPVDLLRALLEVKERPVVRALKEAGLAASAASAPVEEPIPEDLALSAVLGDLRNLLGDVRDELALLRAEVAELRRDRG